MSKQQVRCVWCGWEGPSPAKKSLQQSGKDYPLTCKSCGAIGIVPQSKATLKREG